MKFPHDFKLKVKSIIRLLNEANNAIETGVEITEKVCAYNSAVLSLQKEYGGEWWIFRNKAFKNGFGNDGFMDSRNGKYNPFKNEFPIKKSLTRSVRVAA